MAGMHSWLAHSNMASMPANRKAHVALAFGINNKIRSTCRNAAAQTKQIAESLSIRVDDPLLRIIRDLTVAKKSTEFGQESLINDGLRKFD